MMEESFVDGSHWIASDDIQGFRVETVFLGIDHSISDVEPPLWFETMVFRESANGNLGVKIEFGRRVRPPDTLSSASAVERISAGTCLGTARQTPWQN